MSIVLQDICYRYDGAPVLNHLSLTLPTGSRTVIMGRSGRGKTTLLHLLAGVILPDSGQIVGQPTAALLFQENRLLPWCSVLENLRVALPEQPPTVLHSTLERLGLASWADHYPQELSGGMARRVALARALLLPSDLLLLDEPFAGLDEAAKAAAARLTLELLAGRTLVAVLHDPDDVPLLDATIVGLD